MTKDESDREKLHNLRASIQAHLEDGAMLFQQLPEAEYDFYLVNCIAAWELVASQPMKPELLQRMIETLFSADGNDGNDTEEPISATQSGMEDNKPFDPAAEIGRQWDEDEGFVPIEEQLEKIITELESAIAVLKNRSLTQAPIHAMVEAAKHVWNASEMLPPLDKDGNVSYHE
jgi:hypothetical protein